MSKIVNRTLDVFELFVANKRPLSLSEMTRPLGIPVSSCFDVVQALQDRGYLYELRPRGGFYPTRRLYDLGKTLVEHDPLWERVAPLLEALREATGETVLLAKARDEHVMTYLIVLESSHAVRFSVAVGDRVRSLYATSAGKAYLGGLDEKTRRALLAELPLKPFTAKTLTSKQRLLEDLAASEKRGWYLNAEESLLDLATVSARLEWGGATYIVTVAGTKSRMEKSLEAVAKKLLAACRSIGHAGEGKAA